MSSLFKNLLAKLQANSPTNTQPKATEIEAVCPKCGEVFQVDVDNESESDDAWRTADEAGATDGQDPANTGVDDDSETLNSKIMNNPKSRRDAENIIAQSLLKVSSERTNDPELPSVSKAKAIVEKHAKRSAQTAAEMLSEAIAKTKSEQK